ncbi:ankyrin repeat domain-containing protein [Streptomyces sp. NPDC056056]|uniref:ankyrin repeat domain-containing protein n=1 Tax=Streptomyces sp. NPDC056056 TaxID=3345698 RepID=UPI0035D6072C
MSDYWTPTHFAVEHEDTETLARLLANGADPDEVFSNMTLLTHAIDTEGGWRPAERSAVDGAHHCRTAGVRRGS